MVKKWILGASAVGAVLILAQTPLTAQVIGFGDRHFNEQVLRESGQPVVPIFEGWYEAEDGTRRLCFGYLNPNTVESLEIPLGPNNFLEPARYDGGQPTHFRPVPPSSYRRDYCTFTVPVPADFGGDDRVVWTLESRVGPLSAPGHLMPAYEVDDRSSPGRGDVAPVIRFDGFEAEARGRTGATVGPIQTRVGEAVELGVEVDHPNPQTWLIWAKHRGPGEVEFGEPLFRVGEEDGRGTTVARFSQPGEYILRVQAINSLGSFDFYCCWTNGYVTLIVSQ